MADSAPDENVTNIQRVVRGFCARRRVARSMQTIVEMYIDEESGSPYYYNRRTTITTWEKPKLLQNFECAQPTTETMVIDEWQDGIDETAWPGTEVTQPLFVHSEPEAAGLPNTTAAMTDAWRLVLPTEENELNAQLFRVDVFSSEAPQRCVVVRGVGGIDLAKERPAVEQWELYQSFFAYDRPIKGSTRYEVFLADKPFRCKIVMYNHESVEEQITKMSKGKSREVPAKGRKAAVIQDLSNKQTNLLQTHEGWRSSFSFWAFYDPIPGTGRLNVQRVTNPVRERISTECEVRGGWTNKFIFNGFFALRYAILSTESPSWRQKVIKFPPHACRDSMVPHPPLDQIGDCNTEGSMSQQYDSEEQQVIERETFWAREFEFYALGTHVQGCLRYSIVRSSNPARYKIALNGEHSGWELVSYFFAFSVPYPGTTAYSVQVARNPTRFRVQMSPKIVCKPWKELFTFYAFSNRICDHYHWGCVQGESDVFGQVECDCP